MATLARRAGGAESLVAPKQKKEAAGLSGEALLDWLAADGKRLRRPIIDTGGQLTLGFTAETRQALSAALGIPAVRE